VIMAIGRPRPTPGPRVALGCFEEHRCRSDPALSTTRDTFSQKGASSREYPNGNAVRTKKFAGNLRSNRSPHYVAWRAPLAAMGETVRSPGATAALLEDLQSVAKRPASSWCTWFWTPV